ncbi:MAG: hypothetical protein JWO85_135 [Candidatus Eremiobacteraeota bacterium]|nr:hypothetical protein [Candidatus Eremiobacteraeota bacterium]
MLLDAADDQPLKAESLIRSLVRLGGVAPSRIVVHVAAELDAAMVAPLRELGCRVNTLAPQCDAVARNDVLRHLDALRAAGEDAGGAWLFSLGTAVTAPLSSPTPFAIVGKIADRERLPPEVVERLFRAAGVPLPPVVPCDGSSGRVVATQLDGGLLHIPFTFASALCDELRRFTSIVAARPEIAGEPQRDRLVQELSLALAIAALDLPVSYLGANDSFPLDAETLPASYDAARPVRALRWPRFDAFGLVRAKVYDPQLDTAVAALNQAIAEPSDTPYFSLHKRSAAQLARVPALPEDHPFAAASARWAQLLPHRLKFVLHAGTQKTGTTALQETLAEQVDALAQQGVWYPPARLDPKLKKHQFLIALLMAGDAAGLARAFDEFVRSAPPHTRTILVSTEGLFTHWWDFPPASKAMLRHLASLVDLELWTCFREPMSFAITQYAQFVRNPRQFDAAYGLDIGFDEILEHTVFTSRLDYLGFVFEAQELIGAANVRLFRYGPDIVERVFRALGATAPANAEKLVYRSLRRPGVELMRMVNRYDMSVDETYAAAELVLQLDTLIGERAEPLRASPEAALRVRALTGRGWRVMEELLDRAERAPANPLPQDASLDARTPQPCD